MVQTKAGPSIGIALKDWNNGAGKIMVLVQPGWFGGPNENGGVDAAVNELARAVGGATDHRSLQESTASQQAMIEQLLRRIEALEQERR